MPRVGANVRADTRRPDARAPDAAEAALTEIPEHLLARSKARRSAMGGGGGDDAAAAAPAKARLNTANTCPAHVP